MNRLSLNLETPKHSTELSNEFIDKYMPLANGEFVKVYLYLLRCVSDNHKTISVSALADFFNQTEADIMRALRYWDKVGAIILTFNNDGTDFNGITFCDLSFAENITPLSVPSENMSKASPLITPSAVIKADGPTNSEHISKRAVDAANTTGTAYSPSQIKKLSSHEDFQMLIYAIGEYLGGELNSSELSTMAYLYDTLKFPTDLIEYLVEYCVSKGKKNIHYIEKVALSWADEGIKSVNDAKESAATHKDTTYSVLSAFGITGRAAGKSELDFISRWTNEFGFGSDIIIEACNRTLRATHQPSFEYADSILKKWQEASVKTSEDIKRMDAQFEASQQKRFSKRTVSSANTGSSNRFNNFHQRDTDIESLEKALISNNG